jgi:hypothetical protein
VKGEGSCFVNYCLTKSKDFVDKQNERSILEIYLMSGRRGLKRRKKGDEKGGRLR